MAHLDPVDKFYRSVIEDVILECREIFLDEGIDEAVLAELKQMWEQKVRQSKVFEFTNWHGSHTSFGIGSYGIISSTRHTCPEILVPSIHLSGPRGNGLNNSCAPTATIALPYGLYQQQISALSNAGISLQPNGNGQFFAFLRPDQQRLQSLATSQNIPSSNKDHPIAVSISSSIPAKPETVNLNALVPNQASTSPTKRMFDLKKQILPAPANFPGKDPNGNMPSKETENTGHLNAINIKNTSFNSKSTQHVISKVTNNSIPNNNNNAPLSIKTQPGTVSSNYSVIQNTDSLKTVLNTNAVNNSNAENNCLMGTIPPSVNTNSTIPRTIQNTYLPLNSSNINTAPQASNIQEYNNNQSLGVLTNRFENQPLTNNYSSNSGFYYNNDTNTTSQTKAMIGVSKPATSLEDFIDNMSDSNCESYSNYSDSRPNHLIADGILSSNLNSSIPSNNRNDSNSDTYSSHLSPNSLPHTYKPIPPSSEAERGQMCRISEENMQTIEEILQLDGAGDECLFGGGEQYSTAHSQASRCLSRKQWSVEREFSCEVNDKTPEVESGEFYQDREAESKTKNLHRLKVRSTDSPLCDYIPKKKIVSFRGNSIPRITKFPSGLNINQTMNNQDCYIKTKCLKMSSSAKSSLQNVTNSSAMLALNCFRKWPDISQETPGGTTTIRLTAKRFCSFHSRFLRQFDGEDADSSSSSDDNTNANEAASDDDDDDEDECEEANEEIEDVGVESEPLNSADDDSETDICAMFESENIVVCQFEKVSRNKNKWKFHLKDGIMNLFGRDLIFSKSIGDAEW